MRAARQRATAKTHTFTLVLSGVSELSEEMETALFEAGCDDALLASRDGVIYLDFDREAPSFREAVLSAIADVARAAFTVARVEPDDLVTAAEIARRAGRSRENIRQLIRGTRGPGGFPPPVGGVTSRSPIWRWAQVAEWLTARAHLDPAAAPLPRGDAVVVATVNDALDLLRHLPEARAATQLVRQLYAAGGRR